MNLNKDLKYLVGVSGGPDSMFLLNYLKENQIRNIIVCHVNYNYRSDSSIDESIVRDFCNSNNIQLEILNIQENYQNLKENFESWARTMRYSFFCEIGLKNNVECLLLGHNLNDSIETYLMQKARKNFVNYFGIKPISRYKNLLVIRPILALKKSFIIKNLNENKIKFAIDSTNEIKSFTRNKIRSMIDETSFDRYLIDMQIDNKQLEKINDEVIMYVKNNSNYSELNINKQLQTADLEFIQRCVYHWFEKELKSDVFHNRSNKTLSEIARTIKNSSKSYWKISLLEQTLFKDYNKLKVIHNDMIKIKTFKIKNGDDLKLAENFVNWLEIHNAIKKDKEQFPYFVTNDYEWYKMITFVGNKKTNRFFIDKKIPHSTRMVKAVVFNSKKCKILNSIK